MPTLMPPDETNNPVSISLGFVGPQDGAEEEPNHVAQLFGDSAAERKGIPRNVVALPFDAVCCLCLCL